MLHDLSPRACVCVRCGAEQHDYGNVLAGSMASVALGFVPFVGRVVSTLVSLAPNRGSIDRTCIRCGQMPERPDVVRPPRSYYWRDRNRLALARDELSQAQEHAAAGDVEKALSLLSALLGEARARKHATLAREAAALLRRLEPLASSSPALEERWARLREEAQLSSGHP